MRSKAIQVCIDSSKRQFNKIKEQHQLANSKDEVNSNLMLKLRQVNYDMRIFEQEKQVEEIVKMKTLIIIKNKSNNFLI